MKSVKLLFAILATSLSLSALAAPPSYNGDSELGFVTVNSTITYMEGRVNVRHNPVPGHERSYIYTHHYANNIVWFQGYDAPNNRYFACYINTTDPMYDQAVDMGNNLQDGSRYLIWKDANSSLCTRIGMSNGSDYSS